MRRLLSFVCVATVNFWRCDYSTLQIFCQINFSSMVHFTCETARCGVRQKNKEHRRRPLTFGLHRCVRYNLCQFVTAQSAGLE